MILTDREITIALQCGQIIIDPLPNREALSSTSVDLTLAARGAIWTTKPGFPIRPGSPGYQYANALSLQREVKLVNYPLGPKQFLLAWTRETITLPLTSRLAARVEGKSSLARIGIGVHITAPTIHAGFAGPIQLEIFNFSEHEIILDSRMKICQLIFEQTAGTPDKGYAGQFLGQKGGSIRPSKSRRKSVA